MNRHVPDAFAFTRYEDMHRDAGGALALVLEFMGARVPAAAMATAVEYCRFENLRRVEADGRFPGEALQPANADDPESFKLRKGKVGNFDEYLSPADVAYIDDAIVARGCDFTRRPSPAGA